MDIGPKVIDKHLEIVGDASLKIIRSFETLLRREKIPNVDFYKSFITGMRKMVTGDSKFSELDSKKFESKVVPLMELILRQDSLRADLHALLTYALKLVRMTQEGIYDTDLIASWDIPDMALTATEVVDRLKTLRGAIDGLSIDSFSWILSVCEEVADFYEKHPEYIDSDEYVSFFHVILNRVMTFANTIGQEQLDLAAEAKTIGNELIEGGDKVSTMRRRLQSLESDEQ